MPTPVAAARTNVLGLMPEVEVLLDGAAAVARAAVEAGIALAVGYPGRPGTEVLDTLRTAAGPEMRVEWAVNEKVAVEIAAGVVWSGKRALVGVKMSGLNAAADAVLAIAGSGVNGGLVLVVGDDPAAHLTTVEQDSRYYALMAALPVLEPATPQEALDFVRDAFEISERTGAPVLVRITGVLAGTTAVVRPHAPERTRVKGAFGPDEGRFTRSGGPRGRARHQAALGRLGDVRRLLGTRVRREAGDGRVGAIGVGVAWTYLAEARRRLAPDAPLLKLPASHPVVEDAVSEFLAGLDRVLVVEEQEAVVEPIVRALAAARPGLEVLGKRAPAGATAAPLPGAGDLDVDSVAAALRVALDAPAAAPAVARFAHAGVGEVAPRPAPAANGGALPVAAGAPDRTAVFPAGCPHRGTYLGLRRAVEQLKKGPRDIIVTGDVGCGGLGALETVAAGATDVALGGSIGVAQGFAYAGIGKPVIAAISEGAFFHTGLPALVGAVHRQVDLAVLVLETGATCTSGGQPTPATARGKDAPQIKIEDLARAAQVKRVTIVDPYDVKRTAGALVQAVKGGGVSVVIARRACQAFLPEPPAPPLEIRTSRCVGVRECEHSCIAVTACPALQVDQAGKARIDPSACVGCRLCEGVCPTRAIKRPWRFGSGNGHKVTRA
jgi:indolepyruvate ferredoxin oxidoreductase alpha subunit